MHPRLVVSLTILALLGLLGTGPAVAQEGGDPHLRSSFDRISPDAPGVSVAIANAPPAPPALTVSNSTMTTLEVQGFDREPFLRIGPTGVQGNRRSRTFYISQDPTGSGGVPPDAKAGATPVWIVLAKTPTWRWFDARARWRNPLPSSVRQTRKVVILGPWTIPARYGTESISIEGHIFYKPMFGAIAARLLSSPHGVEVTIAQGPIPGIVVTNTSPKTLEITGRDGALFARVGPHGVDVNQNSATWRDTKRLPSTTGASADLKHIQDRPILSWLERRAMYSAEEPPASIERGGKRATLLRWAVPATLDGVSVPIKGVTEWIPATASSDPAHTTRTGILALLGALAAIAAVILVRRRRANR